MRLLQVLAMGLLGVAPACSSESTCDPYCTLPTPHCVDYTCKECISSFDCSYQPSCDTTNSCVAAPSQCTGDDDNDGGDTDDGPSVANVLTAPTILGVPMTVTGAICSAPATEEDWYRIDLSNDVNVTLTSAGADLDLSIHHQYGGEVDVVESAIVDGVQLFTPHMFPGVYFIRVMQNSPTGTTAAVPYTLTVAVPECYPQEWSLTSCPTPAKPACGRVGVCIAGTECPDDDAGDPDDDGPAGARLLGTAPIDATICRDWTWESDYYKFDVTAGQGKTITVDWVPWVQKPEDHPRGLFLYVLDASGTFLGSSKYQGAPTDDRPLVVTLPNLPAGTYYAKLDTWNGDHPVTYTITGTTQ